MPEKDGRLPSSRSQGDDGSGGESRDDEKRASEGKRASESGGSSGSGQLPSQEDSGDTGRLPSREKEEGTDGGDGPPPSENPAEASPRSGRIQRAIDTGGLDELPKDFGNPDDGDWQIVRSGNPFERLYLDHRRQEEITSEMVRRHFELISSFWKNKIQTLDGGREQQARQIRRKYGGPHNDGEVVRGHLEQTKQAYGELKDAEGRNRRYRKLEESRREEGHEVLRPRLEMALRDGVLELPEVEGLFEVGREAGLRNEEVADFLRERLKAEGFESVGEPEGDTFADRLRSVRWMTPEEHQKLEEGRESTDQQEPATPPPLPQEDEQGGSKATKSEAHSCIHDYNGSDVCRKCGWSKAELKEIDGKRDDLRSTDSSVREEQRPKTAPAPPSNAGEEVSVAGVDGKPDVTSDGSNSARSVLKSVKSGALTFFNGAVFGLGWLILTAVLGLILYGEATASGPGFLISTLVLLGVVWRRRSGENSKVKLSFRKIGKITILGVPAWFISGVILTVILQGTGVSEERALGVGLLITALALWTWWSSRQGKVSSGRTIDKSSERILDKVSEQGYEALSDEEKRTLYGASQQDIRSEKSRIAAMLFALFLGGLGAHRFYLGKTKAGTLMLVFCWTGIPIVVGLIDFGRYLGMSDEKFARAYR